MKYEDLTGILEKEKKKKSTMSRIPPDFYSQVNEYIKELEDAERKISRRHSEEAIMIQYELKNAFSAIEKIFKQRTRKIIKMASRKAFSKNPANISHDIDYMTPEEQDIYNQMLNTILHGKKKTIEPILGIDTENDPESIHEPMKEEVIKDHTHNEAAKIPSPDISTSVITPPNTIETADSGKKDLNKEYIVVRILKDISTFAGIDGRNYSLNAQDVAVLPKVNARALLKRKMAVEIKST